MSANRGYAVSSLDELGDGPGFRKIRQALGVDAFGVNAIVLPPGYSTGVHFHDEQQELYFVHRGEVEIRFGDGTTHRLGAGGLARVDASTRRGLTPAAPADGEFGEIRCQRLRPGVWIMAVPRHVGGAPLRPAGWPRRK